MKEPYIYEFTDFPQLPTYTKADLEEALVNNLRRSILELGKGFAFVGSQETINIGGIGDEIYTS